MRFFTSAVVSLALLSLFALLALSGSALADSFSVGGKELEIPGPAGFTRATSEHPGLERHIESMQDPVNDLLAFYVPDAVATAAASGEMPALTRYFMMKVHKEFKGKTLSARQFSQLPDELRSVNGRIVENVNAATGSDFTNARGGKGEGLDLELILSSADMIPLEMHHEAKHALAYSMFANYRAPDLPDDHDGTPIAMTTTLVNASGRLLYLYAYGSRDDLEWTRASSLAWAESVLAANEPAPETDPSGGIDWGRALLFGLVAGAAALVFGLIAKKNK